VAKRGRLIGKVAKVNMKRGNTAVIQTKPWEQEPGNLTSTLRWIGVFVGFYLC